MKRIAFFVVSAVLSAALVLGATTAPAIAADSVASASNELAATVVVGEITEVADSDEPPTATKLLHVPGEGYLSVDFSQVTLDATSRGLISVSIAVPSGVELVGDSAARFDALTVWSLASGPLTAVAVERAPDVSAQVNQSPTGTATTHRIFAVPVTPSPVVGAAATTSQSLANITADVATSDTYWRSQTDNKIGFQLVGLTSWFHSAYTCSGDDFYSIAAEAQALAETELGYKDGYYNHLVMIFPAGTDCAGALGRGTIGRAANVGGIVYAIGSQTVVEQGALTHELGHNLSLAHSNWLDCASATPNPGISGHSGCTEYEYGAAGDIMGYRAANSTRGSLNSAHAIRANLWPSSAYVYAPQGTTSYVLNSLSSTTGLRSVVVEDIYGTNYFVEFRDIAGMDSGAATTTCTVGTQGWCTSQVASVQIQRLATNGFAKGWAGDASQLIGRTVSGVRKVGYTASQSFTINGITVAVTAISGTQASVTITRPTVTAQTGSVYIIEDTEAADGYFHVGQNLLATLSDTWVADHFAFQWYRNTVAIAGATSQNYQLTAADLGTYIRVRATSTTAGSSSYYDVDPAPYYTGYGPIRSGELVEGTVKIDASVLPFTADLDGWYTDGTTFSYQWRRNGLNIAGATAATYTPVAADAGTQLSLSVTGKKAAYTSVTAFSPAKDYTLTAVGSLAISGTAKVAQVLSLNSLTYTTVDGAKTATRTYEWLRSGVVIAGATASTYPLTAADFGKTITARVTATAAGYGRSVVTSPATASVIRGDIAGSLANPTVTKDPATLILTLVPTAGSITESGVTSAYQWYRDDVAVAGAVGLTYQLTAADLGKAVRARIVATKLNYNSATLYSAPVNYSVATAGSLAISGTVRVGSTLSVNSLTYTTSAGAASPTRTYQWYRNNVAIALATASTYTPVAADFNTTLSVRVLAAVPGYVSHTAASPATIAVAKGVLLGTQAAPTVTKDGALKLTAAPTAGSFTDATGLTYAYQWFRNGVAIVGATLPTFQVTAADYAKTISVRLTVAKLNYTSVAVMSDAENYSLVPSAAVPTITGDVAQGQLLGVAARSFTADSATVVPTQAYVWLRDGVAIAGATNDTYLLQPADVGKTITVRVTATYAGFLQSLSTSAGTQKVGLTLLTGHATAVTVTKDDATKKLTAVPGVTEAGAVFARQWYRNGVAIVGATLSTFQLTAADFGKTISVRVTASKPTFTTVAGFSTAADYSLTPAAAVTISGTPQVGLTLTSVPPAYSTSAGVVSPTFTYQWLRNGVAIAAATGSTYTLVAADFNTKTSVRVVAAVTGFLPSTLTSAQTAAVVKGALAGSLAAPTVTKDPALMKLTASLTAGSVTDLGTTTAVQWLRNGVAIVGATLPTFQLTAADYGKTISVRLTVAKPNYTSAVLTSPGVDYSLVPSAAVPTFTGNVASGQTLTLAARTFTAGGGSVSPVQTYQWLRNGIAIAGATSTSYLLQAADVATTISVRVTATYVGALPSVSTSAGTQKVGTLYFANATAPATVSKSGLVLTAVPGVTDVPVTTYARQWYRNGVAIALATGLTYTLSAADYGKLISVRVTASKASYTSVVAFSTEANYSVAATGTLTLTGTAQVGLTLTPTALGYSTSAGAISPTLSYQWLRNGIVIAGATGPTYTAVAADYNTKLQVRVTAAQAGFLSNTSTSAVSAVVAKGVLTGTMAAPTVTSNPVTFKLTAALTPGSIDQTGLVLSYQWYRNGVAIYLATGSSYQLTAGDYGKDIKVRVTVAKTNYTSVVQYSAVLVP